MGVVKIVFIKNNINSTMTEGEKFAAKGTFILGGILSIVFLILGWYYSNIDCFVIFFTLITSSILCIFYYYYLSRNKDNDINERKIRNRDVVTV